MLVLQLARAPTHKNSNPPAPQEPRRQGITIFGGEGANKNEFEYHPALAKVTRIRTYPLSDPSKVLLTTASYDDRGLLQSVDKSDGSNLLVEYDERGRIQTLSSRPGRWLAFRYDAEGHVARQTFSEGGHAWSITRKWERGKLVETIPEDRDLATIGRVNSAYSAMRSLLKAVEVGDLEEGCAVCSLTDYNVTKRLEQRLADLVTGLKGKRGSELEAALKEAESLALNPESLGRVAMGAAAAFEASGDLTAAEREYRKVVATFPNEAFALNSLGYFLADHNLKLEEAEALIERAVALAPSDLNILDSLGWVYFRRGKLDKAEECLRKAAAGTGEPTIRAHLGDVYHARGKDHDAEAEWRGALESLRAPADADRISDLRRKLVSIGKAAETADPNHR